MKSMILAILVSVGVAKAQMPSMGGSMIHAEVHIHDHDNSIGIHFHHDEPIELFNYGQSYMNQFSVLDNTYYNAQIGWMPDGFISLPADRFMWIEVVDQTAGLMTYEGGRMNNMMAMTMEPIFGTAGSDTKWMWDGTMTHNWYAATAPGSYSATYSVYVGDASGLLDSAYAADTVTFEWIAVPAPGGVALLGLGLGVAPRRRR